MSAVALTAPLHREDLLHFLGYRGLGTPRARTDEALGSVLEEARALVAPRGIHRCVPPDCAQVLGLESRRRGTTLALGLVTIGFDLERRVTELIAQGETTRALLLDAAGSAAAEEAADDLERRIHGGAWRADRGHARRTARRVSPGYGTWPITAQRALFDLLPHGEIQVELLPSCLMTPRKSVSFAIWIGEREARGAGPGDAAGSEGQVARCALCDMPTCPYREGSGTPE